MSQKFNTLEQQDQQHAQKKLQITSYSSLTHSQNSIGNYVDNRENEMQPPSTDPKCGRNTDFGKIKTHESALKRYASRALQIDHVLFSVLSHACIHKSFGSPTMLMYLVSICSLLVCHMRSTEPKLCMILDMSAEVDKCSPVLLGSHPQTYM